MGFPESDSHVDLDLHGVATIRLDDASEHDTASIMHDVGALRARLEGEPDIVVRFVDRLSGGPLTLVGHEDAGFDEENFVLLRGWHEARARTVVPFDRLGPGLEIVCERGVGTVPLLVPILNLVALSKGVLPLHASAFAYEGVGVVVAGWSRAGTTEALLGHARRGATYVGDGWVYVSDDGRHVFGIEQPIRLWDWHVRSLPMYRTAVPVGDRLRLSALRLSRMAARLLPNGAGIRNRTDALVARHLAVDIPPQRVFGPEKVAANCDFDVLFLSVSHESSAITVEKIDPLEAALRMAFSLQYERRELREAYQKFRFAFPSSASAALERAEELERRLLRRTVAGKHAFLVRHPYPVDVDDLADVMSDYLPPHR